MVDMNPNPHISEAVTHLREVLGWSQTELAERMGVKPSMLSLLESGRRGWTAQRVFSAAVAFNCPIEKLMPDPRAPHANAGPAS